MKYLKIAIFIIVFAFVSTIFFKLIPQFDNKIGGFFEGIIWCVFYDIIFGFSLTKKQI